MTNKGSILSTAIAVVGELHHISSFEDDDDDDDDDDKDDG